MWSKPRVLLRIPGWDRNQPRARRLSGRGMQKKTEHRLVGYYRPDWGDHLNVLIPNFVNKT